MVSIDIIEKIVEEYSSVKTFCVRTSWITLWGEIKILDSDTIQVTKEDGTFSIISSSEITAFFPSKHMEKHG